MPSIEVEHETDGLGNADEIEYSDDDEMIELEGLMVAATTPNTNTVKNNEHYEEFRSRLSSFTPANFFAMPLQVSPLVCAVSGWRMKQNSKLLVCEKCEKLLAIKIPQHLSANEKQKLCQFYQGHLWDTHSDHCPYRAEAKRFLHPKKRTPTPQTLPLSLSRLLPPASPILLLLERPSRSTFRNRVVKLAAIVESVKAQEHTRVQLPTDVIFHRAEQQTHDIPESSSVSLLNRIATCCRIEKTPINETAISLALLGWDIQDFYHGTICQICCAKRSFQNKDAPESSKPSKWHHVFDSHRYFCPWVSGLPHAHDPSPLWRILADQILDDNSETLEGSGGIVEDNSTLTDASMQYYELRKLLDAGVSKKRLKRPASWNKCI